MLFTRFIPDQNKHMQLVKPPTCIPTLTQIWSNMPHVSAGEPQRTENTSWGVFLLPHWGGKAGSKHPPASPYARTIPKGEEEWGK